MGQSAPETGLWGWQKSTKSHQWIQIAFLLNVILFRFLLSRRRLMLLGKPVLNNLRCVLFVVDLFVERNMLKKKTLIQVPPCRLSEDLSALFESKQFSDCTLVANCKSNGPQTFHVRFLAPVHFVSRGKRKKQRKGCSVFLSVEKSLHSFPRCAFFWGIIILKCMPIASFILLLPQKKIA